jgi:hypothetical protein
MIPRLIQRQGALHLAEEEDEPSSAVIDPPSAVLELVPEVVARENLIVPLKLEGDTLYLAAADASNLLVRDKLTFILNKDIRLVPFAKESIREALRRLYGSRQTSTVDSMLTEFHDRAFTDEEREEMLGEAQRKTRSRKPPPPPRTLAAFAKGVLPTAAESGTFSLSRDASDTGRASLPGEDNTSDYGTDTMWYYTVEEGQRALMIRRNGRMEVIEGPRRVWKPFRRFERMRHFIAHPGEFLVVRFRDGRQEHIPGPADIWFDPRIHEQITRQDALQLAAKEAVIVYSRPSGAETIARRIVNGPMLFVPAPGEWLHTFAWHGSETGGQGQKKVARGLVFQKLWLMPDQMYHDVTDVRTADDAVLTIKLMIFFELTDIERMLETTHDPVGDFVNAATSDVVDFLGRRTFEDFKKDTGKLNEIETYRQLAVRASQTGYRINKVVYRGYDAPARLQAMHDQAIEARTKLQLERATEEQAQGLEDYKLNAQMSRSARRRTEQANEVQTEIELAQKRQEADLRAREAERTAAREQRRRDAETEQEIRRQADERSRHHLAALKEMGVDLTAYLTQGRADRVIELRGEKGLAPHLHLDGSGVEQNGK